MSTPKVILFESDVQKDRQTHTQLTDYIYLDHKVIPNERSESLIRRSRIDFTGAVVWWGSPLSQSEVNPHWPPIEINVECNSASYYIAVSYTHLTLPTIYSV